MSASIYVTGVGIVSPAGCGADANWLALAGGRRCIRRIDDLRITGGGVACGGAVEAFTAPAGTEQRDRVCQLAAAAGDEAFAAADLAGAEHPAAAPHRLAVSFGTSKGGILSFTPALEQFGLLSGSSSNLRTPLVGGKKKSLPEPLNHSNNVSAGGIKNHLLTPVSTSSSLLELLSDIPPDAPARLLAARYGALAGAHATVAACATGTLAVIRGVQMIVDGQADVVLAGSSDASLHPLWFAAFDRMGVLAREDLQTGASWACRPFDAKRGGFVVSEGAAVLVLESAASVRRRRIRPLARVLGYCVGSDPTGLAQLRPDGVPLAEVTKTACHRAAVNPGDLASIHAHGTGTLINDAVEINAIRRLCGRRVSEIPVVSLKGMVGHSLGAAGSVELAIAVLAATRRICPPNATLIEPDPAFEGVLLPREAIETASGPVLKLSMGFGGHLAAVIIDSA